MADYPNQIFAAKRQKVVLSVEAFYALPTLEGENPDNPLESPGYSRCVLTIIDKSKGTSIAPIANIPENDIAYLKLAAEIALTYRLSPLTSAVTVNAGAELSTKYPNAYSGKFLFGANMGKTYLEVASKNGAGELLKHKETLAKNLSTHPENAKHIQAIDETIELLKDSAYTNSAIGADKGRNGVINVYEQKYKFLRSHKDSEGRCLVYSISIICDLAKNYPFTVTIENAYAHVKTTASGSANVEIASAVGRAKSSISLTDIELISLANKMYETMRDFSTVNFKKRYEAKEKLDDINRERLRRKLG
jgi:hypothetical protein